jgi:hypothetical protein
MGQFRRRSPARRPPFAPATTTKIFPQGTVVLDIGAPDPATLSGAVAQLSNFD